MGQYIIPVLLLATVALSSSNLLPLSVNYPLTINLKKQYNDNIFRSNNYHVRSPFNRMYKIQLGRDNKLILDNVQPIYEDPDNNRDDDILNIYNKNDNYNGEGFRKAQWHNYPRQLDRLHEHFEQDDAKKSFNPDFNNERYIPENVPNNNDVNDITNEFVPGTNKNYHALLINDPLFILKLRLARCLESKFGKDRCQPETDNEAGDYDYLDVNMDKVKREGRLQALDNESADSLTENKAINKRIFSLWSRLQSLNPKGHELQHRRHLHAFYGLPDSDGGGTLTAETRATLLRPPGSPLRWG